MSYRAVRGGIVKRRAHHSAVHFRKTAAASLTLCAALALTACSSSDGKDEASDASPTVQPSSTPAETSSSPSADPGAPVEAAYRKYWDEKVKAYAKASVQGTDLKKYAVAEAYLQAEAEVKALKAKGLVATGKPVLDPKVDSVDAKRKVPQGSLTDCTDVSQWTLVKKSNGQEATLPKDRLTKYVTKIVAEKWYGNWVIVKVTPEDQTC
jgi:hypothetical protein